MDLRTFLINPRYSSITDNPYHDFFVPCFSNSNFYCRYGGFFSSKNLALCAEGIEEFLKNEGKMQLVLAPLFSKDDVEAIKKGILNKQKKVEDEWIKNLDSIKEKFERDHVRALSWMLASDPPRLEIKLAIFKDAEGNILDEESLRQSGKGEMSIGVFHDENGNAISFDGIIKPGVGEEDEHIDIIVHKNWIHREHVDSDFDKFRNYWEESDLLIEEKSPKDFEILELPNAIKQKLLDLKPKSIEELELKKIPKLRKHQKKAKLAWIRHEGRGIFEMATGTGKTFTAIGCLKDLHQKNPGLFTIIACPTQNLVSQWERELKKWDYTSISTLKGRTDWLPRLQKIINDYKYGIIPKKNIVIIVTTYATFSKKEFINTMLKIENPILLIADEVHSTGAPSIQNALLENYKFRLGLSATPERYFDDEGTKILSDYFKPIIECNNCHGNDATIFKMDIQDAIKQEILVPYYYYPHYVDLTEDELTQYKEITKKLHPQLGKKPEERNDELLTILLNKRASIIKNAENKISEFERIVNENKNLDYCLIYCAPSKTGFPNSQISRAQSILNKIPIQNSIIKSDLTNLKEREKILSQIESGLLKCALAINILDEGIDIPPLRIAVVLASTGNPKQFIQRRGRILRTWPGTYLDGSTKEWAVIYDIFVIPYLNRPLDTAYAETEKNIVKKELIRHKEMAQISLNPEYGKERIDEIKKHYSIDG